MKPTVGALALAVMGAGACSAAPGADDTLPPVGAAVTSADRAGAATAPADTGTTAVSAPSEPMGSGAVRMDVRLSGRSEELVFDRASVAAADLDPITLDATCTAIDGGDGYLVSIVDVRRLSAGQQLVSATLRAGEDQGPLAAGEHEARLELGTAQQETTRFEGTMVLDAGLASGTFDLATGNGATATGSFACGADIASLPTTTTIAVVAPTDASVADVTGPELTLPVVATLPTPTLPIATS